MSYLKTTGNARPYFLAKNWFWVFSLVYGVFVGLPFLAPVLMNIGWVQPAKIIYLIYSFLCHQLPERSFFMYGEKTMYSLAEIQAVWENTINPITLRQFIGTPATGWKVAWSDRMISLYAGLLLAAWLWYPLRRKLKHLPLWGWALLGLPMVIDGMTHMVSDFAGIGQGFRDTNIWLAELTNFAFAPGFYTGDALGSFNSWMRLITGLLFAISTVWYGFPYIEEVFTEMVQAMDLKYRQFQDLQQMREDALKDIQT